MSPRLRQKKVGREEKKKRNITSMKKQKVRRVEWNDVPYDCFEMVVSFFSEWKDYYNLCLALCKIDLYGFLKRRSNSLPCVGFKWDRPCWWTDIVNGFNVQKLRIDCSSNKLPKTRGPVKLHAGNLEMWVPKKFKNLKHLGVFQLSRSPSIDMLPDSLEVLKIQGSLGFAVQWKAEPPTQVGLSGINSNLKRIEITFLPEIGILSQFTRLEAIQVKEIHCGLDISTLKCWETLKHLTVVSNRWGVLCKGARALVKFTKLMHLEVTFSKFESEDIERSLGHLKELEHLDLPSCGLNSMDFVEKLPKLVFLSLPDNKITKLCKNGNKVFCLDLRSNRLDSIEELRKWNNLKYVRVGVRAKTFSDDVQILQTLTDLKEAKIDISINPVFDEPVFIGMETVL